MSQIVPQNLDKLVAENKLLKDKIVQLEQMLRYLQSSQYRPKSESLLHPGMKPLFEIESEECEEKQEKSSEIKVPEHTRQKKKKIIPDELPREDVLIDLREEEKSCPCCNEPMKKIKDNFSEKLHIKPAICVVKKYIRPVYACKSCEEIKQAKMPYHPIERCSVTSETLVHIAIGKYLDGMPLHRQEKGFKRHGVEISRDQMARWMLKIGDKARLICGEMHKSLISGDNIAMDETYLQVLKEKEIGRAHV